MSVKSLVYFLMVASPVIAEPLVMEKLVITGTRSELGQQQSPVSIDVVSREQLQLVSHGTLANALNFIPGVVTQRNAKDGYTVQMQGFDGDHVLVLLDSQPLISPTGASVDLEQISVVDIERIEVLRGAASVLYGSSAMGGVINVISRKQQSHSLKLHIQASSYGHNAIRSSDVGQLFQIDLNQKVYGWQSALSVQKIDDPGFDYDAATLAQSAPSSDKTFINLALRNTISDIDINLKTRFFSDDKQKTRYAVPGQSSTIRYLSELEQWQQDLSLSVSQRWKVQGRYVTHQETSGDSNGLRDADIHLLEFDSQFQWHIADVDLVSGLVLHRDELNQIKQAQANDSATVEVNDESRDSVEAYTQLSWPLNEHEILGGMRLQHDSDFGGHSAMRLNGLFNLVDDATTQWQLRAGVGQSYRVPTLKERFYVFDHSNLGYMVLGNTELRPETAISSNIELSMHRQLNDQQQRLSLSANLHYAKASNFINTLTDTEASAASGLLISRYFNVDQAYIKGLDLSLKLAGLAGDYQLSYSYLHATNHDGEYLSERPTHQIKANINWQLPYDMNALVYWVYEHGEHPTAEQVGVARAHWSSVNLNLSQKINSNWQWKAGIDNVFDTHQNTTAIAQGLLDVRPLSSRRVFAGISYQFN